MNAADTLSLPPSPDLPRQLHIERRNPKHRTWYAVDVRVPGCADHLVWQYAHTLRLDDRRDGSYALWAENAVGEGPMFPVTAAEAAQIAAWADIPLPPAAAPQEDA